MSLKILVIGPEATGKTTLSNFLARSLDTLQPPTEYAPTVGVRILECERSLPGRGINNVELWDVSGDSNYDSCWRAVMTDADGVVLVYNPEKEGNDELVEGWYDFFCKDELEPSQCMIVAHVPNTTPRPARPPAKLKDLHLINTCYDPAVSTVVQQNFIDFLVRCAEARE